MDLFIQPRLLVTAVLVAAVLPGCTAPKVKWRSEGRAQAERDIAADKLCLKTYGKLVHWFPHLRTMAKERYGIDFEVVAGCVIDEELKERTEGYNEPVRQEINRRFGKGILEQLTEEARVRYERERVTTPANKG